MYYSNTAFDIVFYGLNKVKDHIHLTKFPSDISYNAYSMC